MKIVLNTLKGLLAALLVLGGVAGCGTETGSDEPSGELGLFDQSNNGRQSGVLTAPNPLDPVDPAIGAADSMTTPPMTASDTVNASQTGLPGDPTSNPECSRSGISNALTLATIKEGLTRFSALSAEESPYDFVSVSIYSEYAGPTAPGTYTLDGINYQDCGLCLTAYSGCSDGGCDKQYYAQEGTVEITTLGTAAGETFAARLIDVKFEEVTISDELLSSPVNGGETWCSGDFSFEETLVDDDDADENTEVVIECPTGEVCVGDTVADFSLPNCASGSNQSIQEYFADANAGWLVLTAGWCPACAEAIPQLQEIEDEFRDRGLKVGFILGEGSTEDSVPDQSYCQRYADRYGIDHDKFFIDNSDGASYRTTFSHIFPYIDESGIFSLPFTAVLNPQTMEYVYADRSGEDIAEVIGALLEENNSAETDVEQP